MCRWGQTNEDHQQENSSMRPTTLAAALFALGSALPLSEPAFAQYGAIAWDRETGKYGASWNKATAQDAAEAAMSDCGATGCKVIIRTRRAMCAALATNESGKYAGGASRKDREAARLAALKDCQKGKAGECIVRVTDCNK
jgi:hypothetical protein